MDISSNTLEFTDRGWDLFYDIVDDPSFYAKETALIYAALKKHMRRIPFCDYLKRFIYRNDGLFGSYLRVPLSEYQDILKLSFKENGTPASLLPSTAKLSAVSTNWLTQKKVSRHTVLLLGFGLGMTKAEVNAFLMKALHEESLHSDDAIERICSYCYEHGYRYPKFEQLLEDYEADRLEHPANMEEAVLFSELKSIKKVPASAELTNHAVFSQLYTIVLELIAANYNRTVLKDEPRRPEEISGRDVEKIFYPFVPRDAYGNLTPAKRSDLYELFEDQRLTRQRINALLRQETPVTRSDLITLNFFIWSQSESESLSPRKRFQAFVADTNEILEKCGFCELYAAIPYESFLMMCMLSDDPITAYMDVWERSYRKE